MNNPYLPQQAQAITQQVNNNLQQQQLPGIRAGAMAAGGIGGSRQGIAEGLAIGQSNQALSGSLANLYGQAYESDQNRAQQMSIAQMQNDTQRYGLTNSYNLGLGQLGLGNKTADQSFYTAQRGQDLQQQNQGFNQYLGALGAQVGLGSQLANIGSQQQQAGLYPLQSYANILGQFSGLNPTQTTSTPATGGGLAGAVGGGLTVAQIIKLLGG